MADLTMGGASTDQKPITSADAQTVLQTGVNAQGEQNGEGEQAQGEEPKPWEKHDGGDWDGVPAGARKRIQKQSAELRALREALSAKDAREQAIVAELLEHRFASTPEPKREDFASEGEYLRAQLQRLQMRERLDQLRSGSNQQEQREADPHAQDVAAMQQSWMQKVEASKADLPDYDAVIRGAQLSLDTAILRQINASEYGPYVLYTIARNGLALDMEDMTPPQRAQFIGQLESKVRAWKTRSPQTQPQTQMVQAPVANVQQKNKSVPPAPPRVAGSQTKTNAANDWIASRNAQFGNY